MKHFIDIGSNTGQTFTEFLSKTTEYDGWTIWCFEPSPRHLPGLIRTAAEHCHRYTIKIFPFGIGGQAGIARLFEKDDPRGDSFHDKLNGTHNLEQGYEVFSPLIQLQGLIRGFVPPEDEVVAKLDCEGSEYSIMESLLSDCPPQLKKLLVEFHDIGTPHRTAAELIEQMTIPVEPWLL